MAMRGNQLQTMALLDGVMIDSKEGAAIRRGVFQGYDEIASHVFLRRPLGPRVAHP
jgi:hypothetical protein